MKLTETTVEPGTISAIRFSLAAIFFLPGRLFYGVLHKHHASLRMPDLEKIEATRSCL